MPCHITDHFPPWCHFPGLVEHIYFYVRCLPRRADKSVLLTMHIWCKTEKLLDMYLYLVSESGPTRDRTRSLVTRREWTSDGLQIWSVSHSQYAAQWHEKYIPR